MIGHGLWAKDGEIVAGIETLNEEVPKKPADGAQRKAERI